MTVLDNIRDVKELRDLLSSNLDTSEELEELLSKQTDEQLSSSYVLRYEGGLLVDRKEKFTDAEDLVRFYNQELKPSRDENRGRFAMRVYEPEKGGEVLKALAGTGEGKAAVVRGSSWALDIHKALSITNDSRREESKDLAKQYISQVVDFKDLMKPWKRPHYSDAEKILDGLKDVYWDRYEQDAVETLQSTILRCVAEAHNPDSSTKQGKPSFYRDLVEEY